MTIKQQGGIFGRNPTFNDVDANSLTTDGPVSHSRSGDGAIVTLKDGTSAVGYIGSNQSGVSSYFAGANGTGISFGSATLYATDETGDRVAAIGNKNIGSNTFRWGSIYLSGDVFLASGQGIDFSATSDGSGTTTGELFSDYEEGTWSPSIVGSTSGSISFGGTSIARYTKIGRVVHAVTFLTSGDMAAHTVSGDVRVSGLPFSATGIGGGLAIVSYCNLTTADEADITISGYISGTSISLQKGSSISALTNSDLVSSGASGAIMLDITYETGA